jgi:hypothetical protein
MATREQKAEAGKALAALRTFPTKERLCEYCKQAFLARGRGRFCKPSHRVAAYKRQARLKAQQSDNI